MIKAFPFSKERSGNIFSAFNTDLRFAWIMDTSKGEIPATGG
jgi:hypothetical protein